MYFCTNFVKLEDIRTWKMQGKDTVISIKEKDELTKELFKNFKINENINLTEKVYTEIFSLKF